MVSVFFLRLASDQATRIWRTITIRIHARLVIRT